VLEPDGVIVFSNNFQRFQLDVAALPEFAVEDMTRATVPEDFARNPRIHACFVLRRKASGDR
jgi:23S rRNA (guanine2445-N2)-methyltransferase / 23S rRNA (guanine2069-N7)-methyltransferase